MIGDPIIKTEKSKRNAKIIFNTLKDQNIILIGGVSGSQKSETAECLQELFLQKNKQSFLLSLDDYYLVCRSIRNYNRQRQGINSVGLKEIDWSMIYRIIEDFENKKAIHFQRYHRYCDLIEHNCLETESLDYLIIEGLYSNYIKKEHRNNYSVYLDANPSQTLEFRKMRGKEETDNEFRKLIVDKEYNIVVQSKKYSDLVIPYENN